MRSRRRTRIVAENDQGADLSALNLRWCLRSASHRIPTGKPITNTETAIFGQSVRMRPDNRTRTPDKVKAASMHAAIALCVIPLRIMSQPTKTRLPSIPQIALKMSNRSCTSAPVMRSPLDFAFLWCYSTNMAYTNYTVATMEMQMAEVNAVQAAKILGKSLPTIHRKVDAGELPARQEGTNRKFIFIDVKDLRKFAQQYGYRFDEALAKKYAK